MGGAISTFRACRRRTAAQPVPSRARGIRRVRGERPAGARYHRRMRPARSLDHAIPLAEEIARERAAALARIGGLLQGLLDELSRLRDAAAAAAGAELAGLLREHAAVREMALRYRWYLVVQREANGLHDQGEVERLYPVPPPLESAEA